MNRITQYTIVALASALVAACGDDNDNTNTVADRSYQVTVANMTHNQPLSPLAVVTHDDQYSAFSIGSAASPGLEQLAEGGDNSVFIGTELDAEDATAASGAAPIAPGGTDTVDITAGAQSQNQLTVVTMLVNTNDAFVGVTGVDVSGLAVGESMVVNAPIYDAGTEANTEASGTIPGPADGGTGYDPVRDDRVDKVFRHMGVVSADDGLTSSVLDESHRFDNPGMKITVTRQ